MNKVKEFYIMGSTSAWLLIFALHAGVNDHVFGSKEFATQDQCESAGQVMILKNALKCTDL